MIIDFFICLIFLLYILLMVWDLVSKGDEYKWSENELRVEEMEIEWRKFVLLSEKLNREYEEWKEMSKEEWRWVRKMRVERGW